LKKSDCGSISDALCLSLSFGRKLKVLVLDAGIFQHTGQLHTAICTTWITMFTYQLYFILTLKEMATPEGDLDLRHNSCHCFQAVLT